MFKPNLIWRLHWHVKAIHTSNRKHCCSQLWARAAPGDRLHVFSCFSHWIYSTSCTSTSLTSNGHHWSLPGLDPAAELQFGWYHWEGTSEKCSIIGFLPQSMLSSTSAALLNTVSLWLGTCCPGLGSGPASPKGMHGRAGLSSRGRRQPCLWDPARIAYRILHDSSRLSGI